LRALGLSLRVRTGCVFGESGHVRTPAHGSVGGRLLTGAHRRALPRGCCRRIIDRHRHRRGCESHTGTTPAASGLTTTRHTFRMTSLGEGTARSSVPPGGTMNTDADSTPEGAFGDALPQRPAMAPEQPVAQAPEWIMPMARK